MGPEYTSLRSLVSKENLHTVCQEAVLLLGGQELALQLGIALKRVVELALQ